MESIELLNTEYVRLPEVARGAGTLLAAIEQATAASPASLEAAILPDGPGIIDMLNTQLAEADELYSRHDALFDRGKLPAGRAEGLDYANILALTKDVIKHTRREYPLQRIAALGIAVAQFAETGARLALDPSIGVIDKQCNESAIEAEIVQAGRATAESIFEETFAHRLNGNVFKFPIGRMGYPGFLGDAHLAFWTHQAVTASLEPEMLRDVQKIIPQFPAKTLRWDMHSYFGRPDRATARADYVRAIEDFAETLRSGETSGTTSNIPVTAQYAFEALETIRRDGYSPDECFDIAVQNSASIGRLTERTTAGLRTVDAQEVFRLDRSSEATLLYGSFKEPIYPDNKVFSAEVQAKLRRRDRYGGICPARYPVLLQRGGETHGNISRLAEGIKERIGASAPLLREANGGLYVDPAALLVNSVLLMIHNNYRS